MDTQIDRHVFGKNEILSGNDYEVGQYIKVKVIDFLGRREYDAYGGEKARTGFYKVEQKGEPQQEFRLTWKMEQKAARVFGMRSYSDLIGKWLTLKVKHYAQGNGFTLEDLRNFESEGAQINPAPQGARGKLI